jgi:tetraacyldisaccharide 4'-kinase
MNRFKTPKFWYPSQTQRMPLMATALMPLSYIYSFFYTLHQSFSLPYKAEVPVVCLGNIVAGGTGKTPTALALMDLNQKVNFAQNPYFLLRGYGGAEIGPLLVDPQIHTAWDVGDEALILAQKAPTIVSADRAAGAQLAQSLGADFLIMDDGLQNPGIYKDIKILVINGEMGFGNGKILPAGPLRQPLAQGLDNADAYIVIGDDHANILSQLPKDKPILKTKIEIDQDSAVDRTQNYIAFAGLGYPDKFFNFLKRDCQMDILETVAFSDHYPYSEEDIRKLKSKAQDHSARLITTEKDFMRIPNTVCGEIDVMQISITFDAPQKLIDLIQAIEKQI